MYRKFTSFVIASALALTMVTPTLAVSMGRTGGSVPVDTSGGTVFTPPCSNVSSLVAYLKALPPVVALAYLRALGWTGTLQEFFALTPAEQCDWYKSILPPVGPRV